MNNKILNSKLRDAYQVDQIESAGDSFGRAGNYFNLMWVIALVICATAFVDYRSHVLEKRINDDRISFYQPLDRDLAELARQMRTSFYLSPGFVDEKSSIESLRQKRSILFAEIRASVSAVRESDYLSSTRRAMINDPLNKIGALIYLNDLIGFDTEFPHLVDLEAIRFAEHSPGSYLTSDSIQNLRIEDAVRFHWYTTLNIEDWLNELRLLREALEKEADPSSNTSKLRDLSDKTLQSQTRSKRALSERVWNQWIISPAEPLATTEKRQRQSLTLSQVGKILSDAYETDALLSIRAEGQTTTVEIPVISMPIQMRDALLIVPYVFAFCLIAILIYTSRALKLAPSKKLKGKVVGNIPIFYSFYGIWPKFSALIAFTMLILPLLALLFSLKFIFLDLTDFSEISTKIFWVGSLIAFIFAALQSLMIPKVLDLIERDLTTKE